MQSILASKLLFEQMHQHKMHFYSEIYVYMDINAKSNNKKVSIKSM